MSRTKEPKPVTWPWVITACLMPVLVAACITVYVFNTKADTHLPRIDSARNQMRAMAVPVLAYRLQLGLLSEKSGVSVPVVSHTAHQSQDLEPIPVRRDEPTEVHSKWSAFQTDFRNNGDFGIAGMRALKAQYALWNQNLSRTVAFLIYNDRFGTTGTDQAAAGGDVKTSRIVSEAAQLRRTTLIGGVTPDDPRMAEAFAKLVDHQPSLDPRAPASGSTLQSIASLQRDLIRVLSSVTAQQYSEAYQNAGIWTRYDDRSKALTATFERIQTDFRGTEDARGAAAAVIRSFLAAAAANDSAVKNVWNEQDYAINARRDEIISDIDSRSTAYDGMVRAHETDAFEFRRLLQDNKVVGTESVLTTKLKPDATIGYVNRESRQCYINLGSADNIHPGMRFEVWQTGGTGAEYQKAMIEVIRILSATHSLCTILDLVESDDPVREGDVCVNVLWENGKYLSVALHGKGWDASSTKYGKFRLKEILVQLGVTVHDQLNPNTDAVILGAQWSLDPVYNTARKHILRDTYTEKRIQMYINPR